MKARAVIAMLLVTLAVVPHEAGAHAGKACGVTQPSQPFGTLRLEAECYNTALPDQQNKSCDPDIDNEHTSVKDAPTRSGGAELFLPHSGCAVRFTNLVLQPSKLSAMAICNSGTGSSTTSRVWISINGAEVASATLTGPGGTCITPSLTSGILGPSTVTLEIRYSVSAPLYSFVNLFVDYIDLIPLAPRMTVTRAAYAFTVETSLSRVVPQLKPTYDASVSLGGETQTGRYDLGIATAPSGSFPRTDLVWDHTSCIPPGALTNRWRIDFRWNSTDDGDGPLPAPGQTLYFAESQVFTRYSPPGSYTEEWNMRYGGLPIGRAWVTYQLEWLEKAPCTAG